MEAQRFSRATRTVQDRRQKPRRSDQKMDDLVDVTRQKERDIRQARSLVASHRNVEALEVLDRAIAGYPAIWELRAEYVGTLRAELEDLRHSARRR